MAYTEKGEAFQFKQGQGIVDTRPFSVISSGDHRIAEKIIGTPGLLDKMTGQVRKVYTGFDPTLADWKQRSAMHVAAFDFDTDLQLDIRKIWREKEVDVDQVLMRKKLMAGSMLKAQERTRAIREKKSWIEKYKDLIAFIMVCVVAIILFDLGFTTHNPKTINILVSDKPLGSTGLYVVGSNETQNVSTTGIFNGVVAQGKQIASTVSTAYKTSQGAIPP